MGQWVDWRRGRRERARERFGMTTPLILRNWVEDCLRLGRLKKILSKQPIRFALSV